MSVGSSYRGRSGHGVAAVPRPVPTRRGSRSGRGRGVPADRRVEAAAELAPVFALLADVETEIATITADGAERARRIRRDAERTAAAMAADGGIHRSPDQGGRGRERPAEARSRPSMCRARSGRPAGGAAAPRPRGAGAGRGA